MLHTLSPMRPDLDCDAVLRLFVESDPQVGGVMLMPALAQLPCLLLACYIEVVRREDGS